MAHRPPFLTRSTSPRRTRLALAASLAASLALIANHSAAQDATQTATQTVTISGRNAASAVSVAGFGDVPLTRAPFSATVLGLGQLQDAGSGRRCH